MTLSRKSGDKEVRADVEAYKHPIKKYDPRGGGKQNATSAPSLPPPMALHCPQDAREDDDSPRMKKEVNILGRGPSWRALGKEVCLTVSLTA